MVDLKDIIVEPQNEPCNAFESSDLVCLISCFRAKKERTQFNIFACYAGTSQGVVVCKGDSCVYGFKQGQIDTGVCSPKVSENPSKSSSKYYTSNFLFQEPAYPRVFSTIKQVENSKKLNIFS
jgi:hypothetical protein